MLSGLGIPNTLLWSEDGRQVHFGDSLDATLYQHSIQADGQLESAQVWFGPHERGGPDGSAMDVWRRMVRAQGGADVAITMGSRPTVATASKSLAGL